MKIEFFGAARAVTGSCHMLVWDEGKLLVDCGMRQGSDAKGIYGEDTFPFDPAEVKAVLLTHAHIDHSGLLPLLVKKGFQGVILCTEATFQLSTIMLPDSAHVQQQEAEWQSRKNQRAGKPPVDPLYTLQDAQNALKLFRGVDYEETIQLFEGVQVRMKDIGHLLGSAAVEIWVSERGKTTKVVFTGDVGRADRPIIQNPSRIDDADYLVLEGTYGSRNHEIENDADKERELCNFFRTALMRGGSIIIPSFAVGRTQELLYYIKRILKKKLLPELEGIPVFIDSPLGIQATKIYERCAEGYYDAEALEMAKDGSPFDFPTLRVAQNADESKAINAIKGRKIIISSSGMCDAGRIRHHLKHSLYRADCTILFIGYQAQGTLGRALIDGSKKVKLFGEEVRVNAAVAKLEGFSGHAGMDELVTWVKGIEPRPRKIVLVHGEVESLLTLSHVLQEQGHDTFIPYMGDALDIDSNQARMAIPAAEVYDVKVTEQDYGIREQITRMIELLDKNKDRRSPDMPLKLSILEADVKALTDKWETLL